MKRLEMDDELVAATLTIGGAEGASDEEHQPHTFLYVPDLSAEKGWSAHKVPERVDKVDRVRRAMGFRR